MLTSKWHMHRMGLIDFWYYTNEEFYFKNGHMMLRGSNGSGKSVTMQSFIPLLLDGNKSSERLDSFGTRSRKIENYLIDENDGRNDRIGYLYLEFKREESDVYKTIGMGLHARKGKSVESWYFVIEDNRRINRDISLFNGKLAITKKQLRNLAGDHQVYDSQKEYMEKVNDALFGFESIELYKEAIALLIQLRSPKLSNSLKPTAINEVLSDSLQPLSEDDLRPMSEAISNMDAHKDRIDMLNQSLTSANNIMKVFDQYNHHILFDKFEKYQREQSKLDSIQTLIQKAKQDDHDFSQQLMEQKKHQHHLSEEQNLLIEEQRTLGNQDAQQLYDEVAKLKQESGKLQVQLNEKTINEENKSNQLMDRRNELKLLEDDQFALFEEIKGLLEETDDLQEDLNFIEHDILKEELLQHIEKPYDFEYTKSLMKQEIKALEEGIQEFQKYNQRKASSDGEKEHLDNLLSELEKTHTLCKQYEEQYRGIVEEYKESFRKINDEHEILKLSENTMRNIFSVLVDYEEKTQFFLIQNMINEEYQENYKKYLQCQTNHKQLQNLLNDQLNELQNELTRWQKMDDPSPEESDTMIASRLFLEEHHIAYRPLYHILEFDESISEGIRNIVEEIFVQSGLLDTLLVEKCYEKQILKYETGKSDRYIFIDQDPQKLSSFFFKGNDLNEIEKELQVLFDQLHIEKDAFHLYDEYYTHGIIHGTFAGTYPSIYIGKQSRETYRMKKIEELENEISDLAKEKVDIEALLKEDTRCLNKLEEEKDEFPDETDIKLADKEVKDCQREIETKYQAIKQSEKRLKEQQEQLKELMIRIQEIAAKLNVSTSMQAFQQRRNSFTDYQEILQKLENKHLGYINKNEMSISKQYQCDELIADIDILKVEIEDMSNRLESMKMQIEAKQHQLDKMGFTKIQERIKEITKRLREIPDELNQCNQKIGSLDEKITQIKSKLNENEELLKIQEQRAQEYEKIVSDELNLHYVFEETMNTMTWINQIESLKKSYHFKRNRDTLNEDLQQTIYTNRDQLQENNVTIQHILPYENVSDVVMRLDIETRYQGNRIPLQKLLQHLEDDITLEESLLLESDKNLFEEILVNVISKQIRRHIQDSFAWVERMNRYMAEMNTSSGLKLSLKWEKKKAESQDELNTRELIELLQTDPAIMKIEQRNKLSTHFRSKIDSARTAQDKEGNIYSFHQLMRDVMDYRKWFEFKIMTQKTGEAKRELTNALFFSYSGGEKAMSMYVPLFSAVAAKFENARDEAPLLIALDEAFAGVDEKNIDNMFGLIEKFKFDYIMNSQVLWGDYASVKALAIYELFRPENAKFVTVIAYEWDGKEKRMKM